MGTKVFKNSRFIKVGTKVFKNSRFIKVGTCLQTSLIENTKHIPPVAMKLCSLPGSHCLYNSIEVFLTKLLSSIMFRQEWNLMYL